MLIFKFSRIRRQRTWTGPLGQQKISSSQRLLYIWLGLKVETLSKISRYVKVLGWQQLHINDIIRGDCWGASYFIHTGTTFHFSHFGPNPNIKLVLLGQLRIYVGLRPPKSIYVGLGQSIYIMKNNPRRLRELKNPFKAYFG